MAKLALLPFTVVLGFLALTSAAATTYIVGDNSGWDISTDLDTWTQDKKFVVGDVLLFQYTSSENVNEVTEKSFDSCNTTNVIKSYTNGNTTITLSRPGAWYFISGNKLYCLGGMKLQANVQGNQADSPAAAPQARTGATDLPQPSSKNNNPIPTSTGFTSSSGKDSLLKALFGFVAAMLWLVG